MFTTTEEVLEYTGYTVSLETVTRAQAIIEAYCGRSEVEVRGPHDRLLLSRATAYQAAYMENQGSVIFEQISAQQIGQMGQVIQFKQNDDTSPWIAPLAVLACKGLSWRRSRSVRVGSMFYSNPLRDGWLYE